MIAEKQKVQNIIQERELEYKKLSDEISTYKKIIENYEIEIMERKGQHNACETMISELTFQMDKNKLELEQKLRQAEQLSASLQSQIKGKVSEMEEMTNHHDNKISEHQSQIDELKEKLSQKG